MRLPVTFYTDQYRAVFRPVCWLVLYLAVCTQPVTVKAQVGGEVLWEIPGMVHTQDRHRIDSAIGSLRALALRFPDSAVAGLEQAYQKSKALSYSYGMASALISAGNVWINIKNEADATPAFAYFRRAAPYLETAAGRDPRIYSTWHNAMGAAFGRVGAMDSAMVYFSQSLDQALKMNLVQDEDMVSSYINLQVIHFEMKQYDKVISYAKQAIRIAAEKGYNKQLYQSYMILAAVYAEQHQPDSCLHYLSMLGPINYKPGDYDHKMVNEITATVYLGKGQPEKAIPYFRKAIAVNSNPSPVSLRGLGRAYALQKQYGPAEKYLLAALAAILEIKVSQSFLVGVHQDLAALYDSTGNYRAAYAHRSQEAMLQKELDDKNKIEVVNTLEGRFHRASQDKQLSENKIQLIAAGVRLSKQNFLIGGIALFAVLLATLIVVLYQKQKLSRHKARTLIQYQEIEKLRTAIDAEEKERSRIGRQLHDDIMVQLSIVKMNMEALPAQVPGVAAVEDYHVVKELLQIAGRDLRQTAHNLAPDTLLADGLIQALLYFFKNVQHRSRLAINFQYYGTPRELPQEAEINIYRITQELIQNIIKHARATNVLVQLSYREDMLTLTIEDDGIGFDTARSPDKTGIGLKSIQARLKVMNGEMDIHPRHPQGTSVTIEVYI